MLTTLYKYSTDHKFQARGLVNRKAVDEVLTGSGSDVGTTDDRQFPTSSIYTADQLGMGQIEGSDHFSLLDVDWRASWAPSMQDQPDAKYFVYTQMPLSPPPVLAASSSQSPQRTYTTLNEFLQDYYIDTTKPFDTALPFTDVWDGLPAKAKAGVNYTIRDRDFEFRSFRINGDNAGGQLDLARPPNSLLIPRNFSVNGPFEFNQLSTEPFTAGQDIAAAYGMVDLPLVRDRLRFVGGARVEYSYITTTSRDRLAGFVTTNLNDLDPLPGVTLIYTPRDDMSVRAAYSQTVSRPEFRELTPTQFPVLPGERTLQGNQFLISSNITNYDLRWDWFFSPLELASASVFYKEFRNPIELVTAVETGQLIDTWVNYNFASLWGIELELRKDFAFLTPYAGQVSWMKGFAGHLADLQMLLNVSYIQSETSEGFIKPEAFTIAPAPGSKPMQGQPPYLINLSLQYANDRWGLYRLLYSTVGTTIDSKGVDVSPGSPSGVLPDIEEQQRNQLDFVWIGNFELYDIPISANFAVENILNDVYLETQGPQVTNRYYEGATFNVGLSYSY
ncbi:MAG: TonB-dependent receptor domain-containing protein [Mycobacterium sp.]